MRCMSVLQFIDSIHVSELNRHQTWTRRHKQETPIYHWRWGLGWVPWASKHAPLFYTPECGVSNELLLGKNRDAFRFDYVFTFMHTNFTNILSLSTGLLHTVSTILKLESMQHLNCGSYWTETGNMPVVILMIKNKKTQNQSLYYP